MYLGREVQASTEPTWPPSPHNHQAMSMSGEEEETPNTDPYVCKTQMSSQGSLGSQAGPEMEKKKKKIHLSMKRNGNAKSREKAIRRTNSGKNCSLSQVWCAAGNNKQACSGADGITPQHLGLLSYTHFQSQKWPLTGCQAQSSSVEMTVFKCYCPNHTENMQIHFVNDAYFRKRTLQFFLWQLTFFLLNLKFSQEIQFEIKNSFNTLKLGKSEPGEKNKQSDCQSILTTF